MKPIIYVNKENEKDLLDTVFKYIPLKIITKSKFKISDRVRIGNKSKKLV